MTFQLAQVERMQRMAGLAWATGAVRAGSHTRIANFDHSRGARAFARRLNLKSGREWRTYCQSGRKPNDIPNNPSQTYAKNGWAGMGDWLGTGTIAAHLRKYLPFREARAFVCSLNLKSEAEWRAYVKSGKKPSSIPSNANNTYANDGWNGWGDWLGTGKRRGGWRSFEEARTFVRGV
jgi:hypothetical protein